MSNSSSKIALSTIAAIEWFALITQLVLIIENRVTSIPLTLIEYISYFTILTNGLVAIYCTVLLLKPASRLGLLFSKPTSATAIAVYIAVVGIVYNTVLRFLWNSGSLQTLVHELLHTVTPLAFVAYWFFCIDKKNLSWTSFYPWLLYPLIYCIYVLVRGALSHSYPYPFMNVDKLGYAQVTLNSLAVTAVFVGFSLLFIGIGKIKK